MRLTQIKEEPALPGEVSADPRFLDVQVLIDDHGSALMSLASIILVDRAEAEAVTSQLLVEVARRPFDVAHSDVRRYLSRLLYQACARSRRDSRSQRDQKIGHRMPFVRNDATMVLLPTLSEQERSAIALCVHGGHSYQDVAVLMALPVPVVLSLLHSGMCGLQS